MQPTSSACETDKSEIEDLFEDIESLPENVQNLIARYNVLFEDECSYKCCREMLSEMESLGYTFEYGLDGEPFNLEAITEEVPQ